MNQSHYSVSFLHCNVTESGSSQWASVLASIPAPMIPPTMTFPHIVLPDVGIMLRLVVFPLSRHSIRRASSLLDTRTLPGASNSHMPFLLVAVHSIPAGQSLNRTFTTSVVPLVMVAQPGSAIAHKAMLVIAFMLFLRMVAFPGQEVGPLQLLRSEENSRLFAEVCGATANLPFGCCIRRVTRQRARRSNCGAHSSTISKGEKHGMETNA